MNVEPRDKSLGQIDQWYDQTTRAATLGLIVMLALATAKFLGGYWGHSLALLSDSLHSLGDAIASAMIVVSLHWSRRPADREHPYGHSRIESIAASNIALLLMVSSGWIVWEAIHTWSVDRERPHAYALFIAVASVGVNEVLYRYSAAIANRTGSQALKASAWDQRLDVLGSLIVVVGVVVARFGGERWHAIDHLAALGVAGIIAWAAGGLYWTSIQELMDRQAPPEVLDQIRQLALAVPGVAGVDKLRVRKAGIEYLVDIHIEVPPAMSIAEAHRLGHAVKDHLIAQVVAVKDVLGHVEPAPGV
ncbi:MAG TPA: cation diffusion facilitator family transporter [Pirellulales bacterium]|nr:cation diffusion facilitator family transporter [Pirellulales bacterium]